MSMLVSKEALGPQECSPTSQSISTIIFRGKNGKYTDLTFPLYLLEFPLCILYKKSCLGETLPDVLGRKFLCF